MMGERFHLPQIEGNFILWQMDLRMRIKNSNFAAKSSDYGNGRIIDD